MCVRTPTLTRLTPIRRASRIYRTENMAIKTSSRADSLVPPEKSLCADLTRPSVERGVVLSMSYRSYRSAQVESTLLARQARKNREVFSCDYSALHVGFY